MITSVAQIAALVSITAVSCAVIYCDLRMMRIPNILSGIVLTVFLVLIAPTLTLNGLVLQLAICAVVGILTFTAFFFRALGGGDVKILTALSLFIPLSALNAILLMFSLALVISTSLIVLGRRLVTTPDSEWVFLRSEKLPMGVAIGLTGACACIYTLVSPIVWGL